MEVAGAAYRQERATASRLSNLRLRWRRRRLSRREDNVSRARLRAILKEMAGRDLLGTC
ncbi:MAG TPA: hypothetical protein VIL36_24285 [Acidimicrobiales bacterium]